MIPIDTSTIHAIVIGVDEYENTDTTCKHAIKDRNAMCEILIKLGIRQDNIHTFDNAQSATVQAILGKLDIIVTSAKRDPIIFYYSGCATDERVTLGPICLYDTFSRKGFQGATLLEIFDYMARLRGNNIFVFLDCQLQGIDFGIPTSCVIVGPRYAAANEQGGVFTQALIKFLSDDIIDNQQPLDYWTVQAFAAQVQNHCPTNQVLSMGRNVDRPLFNLRLKVRPGFVTGQVNLNGEISLDPGAAHGMRINAVYGIYNTNVESYLQRPDARIGELRVIARNDRNLTAMLSDPGQTRVPPFFFAVEERDAFGPLPIVCAPDVEEDLKNNSGSWRKVSDSEKPVAGLKTDIDGTIYITWLGLENDEVIRVLERKRADASIQMIHRAARFYSHLAESKPPAYVVPTKVLVRLQKVPYGQDLKGSNEQEGQVSEPPNTGEYETLLFDDKFSPSHLLESRWKSEDIPASYGLTITNKNEFNVWLYVYLFDVEGFAIVPWYESPFPLGSGESKVIGIGNCSNDIPLFKYQTDRDYDFIYLKIIVSCETPLQLNFITQPYFDDNLKFRDLTVPDVQEADQKSEQWSDNQDPASMTQGRQLAANWASMTIRIINNYTQTGWLSFMDSWPLQGISHYFWAAYSKYT